MIYESLEIFKEEINVWIFKSKSIHETIMTVMIIII